MSLSVAPVDGETDVLGKTANELQSNISISGSKITGSLANVTEYTGYSDQPEEQSGHYLALKFEPNYDDSEITVEIVGNGKGPKKLKSRDLVARITDNSHKLKFVTTRNDEEDVKVFTLTDLTLEE